MSHTLGSAGEEAVVAHLRKNGFSILERNYRIRGGEIDIIARKKDLVVFIEVKARIFGTSGLSEVVTPTKQAKIIFTAKHFLTRNMIENTIIRFDVALVEGKDFHIIYIPNAFNEFVW